jgi:hypothetical protein
MLFREIIAVYCENHTEHTSTLGKMQSVLNVNVGDKYNYQRDFKS